MLDAMGYSLAFLAALIWLIILCLPWRPWRNGEVLEAAEGERVCRLNDVTVVIPARNEAAVIASTLKALSHQGEGLKVILVDDASTDATAAQAKRSSDLPLKIIPGARLPPGWSGKLWALEQGVKEVKTPYTLLLDADIKLDPGLISQLRQKMAQEKVQLVSLMASLRMEGFWEKLLLPAFVYFFKMVYPFRLANSKSTRFAAAAGGCILLETRAIQAIGGFAAIKDALIDDCALAKKVKASGYKTWTGLSRSVHSVRAYTHLEEIWDMVARNAFTQLRYSGWLLAVCTGLLILLFWLPLIGLFSASVRWLSLFAFAGMVGSYLPTLRFYRRNWLWALALPAIGALYLAMTWSSALRFWRGERSRWKGRIYRTSPGMQGQGRVDQKCSKEWT